MPRKRAHYGSVRRLPSGTYQASIPNPDHPGKRISAPHTFTYSRDAWSWIYDQRLQIEQGTWGKQKTSLTFGQYATTFLQRQPWSTSTRNNRTRIYRNHIRDYWDEVPLESISPTFVLRWIEERLRGLSAAYRKDVFRLFNQILLGAEDEELIERNPASKKVVRRARGPRSGEKLGRRQKWALSPTQIKMLSLQLPDNMRVLFYLLTIYGLRTEEVRGIKQQAINFTEGSIRIRSVVTGDGKNREIRDTTKTPAGTRTIYLGPITSMMLKEYISVRSRKEEDYVFQSPTKDGEPIGHGTIYQAIHDAVERLGYPAAAPHDMRHGAITCASRLKGFSRVDLKTFFGHAHGSKDITEVYEHTDEDAQRRLGLALEKEVLG